MEMQGHRHLAVTQQQAWDALRDPQILRQCIPGCERFEAAGGDQYAVEMGAQVGSISVKFTGKVVMDDMRPPRNYRLLFEGDDGGDGSVKGVAAVTLTSQGAGCDLHYTVNVRVGGKLARLEQQAINNAGRTMVDAFFQCFDEEMQERFPVPASIVTPPPRSGWWVRLLSFLGLDAKR